MKKDKQPEAVEIKLDTKPLILWKSSDHDARSVTGDTLVLAPTEAEAIALIDEKLREVGCRTSDEYPFTVTKVARGLVSFTG